PKTLSGVLVVRRTAVLSRRLRSVVRAGVAQSFEAARFNRHGAPCRTSAAMPPMCGDASDVPKNVLPNEPAPVIDTPSIAEMWGFGRPSTVGPRLLKYSAVRLVVSRHDSFGTRLLKNAAALSYAEQSHPAQLSLL